LVIGETFVSWKRKEKRIRGLWIVDWETFPRGECWERGKERRAGPVEWELVKVELSGEDIRSAERKGTNNFFQSSTRRIEGQGREAVLLPGENRKNKRVNQKLFQEGSWGGRGGAGFPGKVRGIDCLLF
jgi:hypothetical protein